MEDFFYPKLKKFHGLDCPKIERRMTIKSLQRPKRPALSHRLVHIYFLKVLRRARHRLIALTSLKDMVNFL